MEFINRVKDKIDLLYIDPSKNIEYSQTDFGLKIISPSENADYVILNSIEELEKFSLKYSNTITEKEDYTYKNQNSKQHFGVYKKVGSNKDIDEIKTISEKGADFVIIDVDDWKIIPLENIIAILQKTNTEIFRNSKVY